MKSFQMVIIAAVVAACPQVLLHAAVQGTFVAHVVEVIPPRSEERTTHTFTTPSASLDLPVNYTALNSVANVTLNGISLQITSPATTPKGKVVGATSIAEDSASVEFLAGGSLRTDSSISATFTIPDLSSTPREVFAYGTISNSYLIQAEVARDAEVITPHSTASVSTSGGASITTCAYGNGAVFGYPSTARVGASTTYFIGAGYASGSSSWSVWVRVTTLYDFAEVSEPGSLKVVKVVEDCEVKLPGKDWVDAKKDMVLPEGTQISTGPDGELHLLFGDGSVMIVKQMTEALVSTLLKQGNAFKAQVLLKIGEVSAQVNPAKVVTSDHSVATPVATASVRGTVFAVSHVLKPVEKSFIFVEEGSVEVVPLSSALETVTVTPGNVTNVSDAEISSAPIAELEPPTVRGKKTFTTTRSRVTVRGKITSDGSIAFLEAKIGKGKYSPLRRATASTLPVGQSSWSKKVKLRIGNNLIKVRANDVFAAKSKPVKIEITRKKKAK